MGTTNVIDAITNETIHEGEAVIAILLSASKPRLLGLSSSAMYAISSFPMDGIWDGNYVIPHDDMSFSSTFNQIMVQRGHGNQKSVPSTFTEAQRSLSRDPVVNGETYSMMIIKASTYDLLRSMQDMDFRMSHATPETDIANMQLIADQYLRLNDMIEQGDGSAGMLKHLRRLHDILMFRSYDSEINGVNVPMVGDVLIQDSHCKFSKRLVDMVENMYGFEGVPAHLAEYRELPPDYNEIITQLHRGDFIARSLEIMGRQLMPSMTSTAGHDDLYNLEMAAKVMQREVMAKLGYARERQFPGLLADVDKEIEAMKRSLAEMVKLKNSIAREICPKPLDGLNR